MKLHLYTHLQKGCFHDPKHVQGTGCHKPTYRKTGNKAVRQNPVHRILCSRYFVCWDFINKKCWGKTGDSIYNIVHNQLYLRDDSVDMGGKERKGCNAGMMSPFLRAFPIWLRSFPPWSSQQGFGNIDGEYWLGLENIYWLTNQANYKLMVTLEDWSGRKVFAEYASFRVESEADFYKLRVGRYHGNAGDSLTWHNGKQFTTLDRDHDTYTGKKIWKSTMLESIKLDKLTA